ncbi:MAG: hypothetical protein IIU28_07205 [Lachnospiraceae bacterium]|nr:hypothetical protein [Lachnospiraceae bacterium]
MISLAITDVKGCMAQMLGGTSFDHFTLSEATIMTRVSYVIDGHLRKEEDVQESGEPFTRYGKVRPLCFDMIKGKRAPEYFKFVFHLPGEAMRELVESSDAAVSAEDVLSLNFTIRFQENNLTLLTGNSLRIFTQDQTLHHAWDSYVEHFLDENGIKYEHQ